MAGNHIEKPFRFDLRNLTEKAKRLPSVVDGITLNFPFVSISVKRDTVERDVAREIVIRLSDKRVLDARECCDNCARSAISSIQEIRRLLIDKQVQLSNRADSALYLLIEFMLEAIRQFLTFTESLGNLDSSPHSQRYTLRTYLAAIEMLRAHLYRCLEQISTIADIKIPNIRDDLRYDMNWDYTVYLSP